MAFCENNLHQITYLPKSYLWAKNEGNRFFNSCHSMVDISLPSLLNLRVLQTGSLRRRAKQERSYNGYHSRLLGD